MEEIYCLKDMTSEVADKYGPLILERVVNFETEKSMSSLIVDGIFSHPQVRLSQLAKKPRISHKLAEYKLSFNV